MTVDLDPRWEWTMVQALGMPDRYIRVRCLHTETVRVESIVTGETLAWLCPTCDTQFNADNRPPPDPDLQDALIAAWDKTSDPAEKEQIRRELADLLDGY